MAVFWLSGCLLLGGSLATAADSPAELAFSRHSEPVATPDLAWIRSAVPMRAVRVVDPYEEDEVEFEAFAFDAVLDAIYGTSWRDEEEVLFRCRDGYQPTIPVARIVTHQAWLAFARRDRADFTLSKRESGVLKQIELAPFYLVWENLDDAALRAEGDYGWPYQLVAVNLIRARDHFPMMAPPMSAPAAAQAGFAAFRVHCSRCHTLNGEGGSIGPELNAPVPAAQLRDAAWLRRWIDDPSRVLPTARMPRMNPALAERERTIDDIIRYLQVMAAAKMDAEVGFFAAFYASPIQHPWLLWLAAALGLVQLLTRTGLDAGVRRYGIALACLSVADAWLTSSHIYGIGALSGGAATAVPLFFVLMGDFRYLLLVTSGTVDGRLAPNGRRMLAAAGLTLIVPIATQLILAALPESHAGTRVMFAIYEVAFFALSAVLLRVHPNARANPWIRSVGRFVMLYYGLWATADLILLGTGSDLGFLLRVLPNLLYYGGLIAAIALFAPPPADSRP